MSRGWNKTGLYAIVNNEIYTGTFVWGHRSKRGNPPVRAENVFPELITNEAFKRIKEIMGSRRRQRSIPKGHPVVFY
jgi:hypothetical protein